MICVAIPATGAQAAPIPITAVADLAGTSAAIGARIRWGGTGFEAPIFGSIPFAQTPTPKPDSTPVSPIAQG
jgi:hypothetical protein